LSLYFLVSSAPLATPGQDQLAPPTPSLPPSGCVPLHPLRSPSLLSASLSPDLSREPASEEHHTCCSVSRLLSLGDTARTGARPRAVMPKKRHTNRFSKPQSTAPASLASSSTSATRNEGECPAPVSSGPSVPQCSPAGQRAGPRLEPWFLHRAHCIDAHARCSTLPLHLHLWLPILYLMHADSVAPMACRSPSSQCKPAPSVPQAHEAEQ
jgi:hypothetical protein